MEKRSRLIELDALRGIAALSVVLFHYTYLYGYNYGHLGETYIFKLRYGYLGVQLFFIISGFVIYMTILKCKTVKEFIVKRLARIYPAYITGVIVTFIFISLFGMKNMNHSLTNAIFNITMIEDILPTRFTPIDGSYWSLAVEMYFYLACCVLFAFGLLKKPLTVSFSSFICLFTVRYLFTIHKIHPFIGDHVLIQYSHLFIAGIMFYKLMEHQEWKYNFILLLSLIYEFTFYGKSEGFGICFFFLIFYALIKNWLKFLNFKPLIFLGTISYSLYLIHQSIGYIIIYHLEKIGLTNELFILIPIAFSIILATIITFYVEKPLQKLFLTKLIYKESIITEKNKTISV